MWYVYILQSFKDQDLYVGLTNDLKRRLTMHNEGKVFSTQPRRPFKIIFYEAFCMKHDAALREKFLKTGWGKQWIQKNLEHYFRQNTE